MAKHRRKKKFGEFNAFPGLEVFKGTTNGVDVLIGVGVGLAGIVTTKILINKFKPATFIMPDLLQKALPLLGGLVVGGVAYVLAPTLKMASKANGLLLGALGAGAALTAHTILIGNETMKGLGYANYADFGLVVDTSDVQPYTALNEVVDLPQFSDSSQDEVMDAMQYANMADGLDEVDAAAVADLIASGA